MTDPKFIIVDLFCGAGGVSTGFAMAEDNIAKVIACVNHDAKAIESHWKNHPEVKHFNEDIRTLDLTELIALVADYRCQFPDAYLILWASLECTNFSKAKGGQPREADSRTLADHLHRYISGINPDYVQIENVVEFMSWGPLDENGKPVSRKNGSDWMRWCKEIDAMGYRNEWKELNSANFGAYTSRNRLFGIFAKDDMVIAWPESTHAKNPSKMSMYGDLKKWMPVKDVLDFSDEGESIFNRKKDLSDKTLERIYAGLVKYVANGDTSFISKYFSGRPAGKVISVDGPAGTILTADGQSLVQTQFLLKYNSMDKNGKHTPPSINEPCPVVSCQGRLGLVQPEFLSAYYGNGDNVSSIEDPAPTLTTKDRVAVVQPKYLVNYNHSSKTNDINEPSPTLLTRDKIAIVQPKYFIDKHFGKAAQNQSVHNPAGTIMPNDKHRLVECTPFIMPTNFDNKPTSIENPLPVITANRKHHYIVNPSHGGHCTSTEVPCPVIVARQDKAPLYVVQAEKGKVSIPVYNTDTEICIKIKSFMAIYELVDIKMRMLRVVELLKIQGFPAKYVLMGNQADQKKFIGNSVVPHVVKAWIESMNNKINELKTKSA
jgi:DNA (cytosine-5)-methyltransferase 1